MTQNFPKTSDFITVMRIADKNYIERVLQNLHYPKAYTQIIDENGVTILIATASSFKVTYERNSIFNSFSLDIALGSVYNPRTDLYYSLLMPDIRKTVHVYCGQRVGEDYKYEKILTGIMNQTPESYKYNSFEMISISGYSTGYLLDTISGAYEDEYELGFTGTSKELIQYYLDKFSIKGILEYEDYLNYDHVSIDYATCLNGINIIKQILGPSVEFYFDPHGNFFMRNIPVVGYSSDDIEFSYTDINILNLNILHDFSGIVTEANVYGINEDSTVVAQASSTLISKYGVKQYTLSSYFIDTAERATTLANDILRHSKRFENGFEVEVILNPYLRIGSLVQINANKYRVKDVKFYIEQLSHEFTYGSAMKSKFKGYLL